MWIWRKMENISWTAKVSNSEVLNRVKENHCIISTINQRKRRCLGHVLQHDVLLRDVLEGGMTGKRTRGRKRLQLMSNIGYASQLQRQNPTRHLLRRGVYLWYNRLIDMMYDFITKSLWTKYSEGVYGLCTVKLTVWRCETAKEVNMRGIMAFIYAPRIPHYVALRSWHWKNWCIKFGDNSTVPPTVSACSVGAFLSRR